jgi:putative pyoverdin transport system ATP-binding/permease protein
VSALATLFAFVYRQARGLVSLAVAAGLVSGAAGAAQIAVLNAAMAGDSPHRQWLLAAAFAVLLLAAPATRLVSQYLLVQLGQGMLYELRLRMAGRILATPLARLERLGSGKLLVALTDDTAVITDALSVIPEVASNGALFLGGLVYLGWLSPALLGLFLLLFIPFLILYRAPITSSFARYRLARDEEDALYGYFTGITAGTKELKLNRERRGAYLDRLGESAGALRRLFTRADLTLAAVAAGGWTFFMAVIGLIVFAAPGFTAVPRETLVGYVLVLLYIRGPLQQIISNLSQLGRGGVAIAKLERLGLELHQDSEPEAAPGEARGGRPWRRLELDGVTFTFRREAGEADFVLGPLDLALHPGELVFLIGGNGSGKTSFAKLLLGLYEPESGEIRWDGERVDRAGRDRYRQSFSAVFFDFHLFDELPGAAGDGLDEAARRHLRELQLEGKVEIADGRLSTTALSQGQRKRLALLSAYLEDRPLYLFDEWAADQDPYFKEIFYRRLLPRLKAQGKTVLVISHDDRYFDVADRVVRFSEGQIVFDGPVHDVAELRQALLADCAPGAATAEVG